MEKQQKSFLDSFLEPDRHYMKVYKMHCKTRIHSYVNICWMSFTAVLALYFAYYLYFVETDVKCIALKFKHTETYIRFASANEIAEKYDDETMSMVEDLQDVSDHFEYSLRIVFFQALNLVILSFLNFLSHFFIPKLLKYSKQIKSCNTINLVLIGAYCLYVLVSRRMNEAAAFCAGER